MFKEQIIRPAEVEKFENTLQEHQKAMTGPAGKQKTVLQNSMIEHNMLAASKIYNNIKFDQLVRVHFIPDFACGLND
jgi:COP9 signalosome complex subunit 4